MKSDHKKFFKYTVCQIGNTIKLYSHIPEKVHIDENVQIHEKVHNHEKVKIYKKVHIHEKVKGKLCFNRSISISK